MREIKFIEIRDRATFIPALAIRLTGSPSAGYSPEEAWLARRAGYGPDDPCVLLARLGGGHCTYDPYDWKGCITMSTVHQYLISHWSLVEPGSVVDAEFIRGESSSPKPTERHL